MEINQNNRNKVYSIKYCQLCLVVDVWTFAMNAATLEAYSKLFQLPLHNKEPYICYECSALLLKYQEFHAKCIRAHNVLTHFKTLSSKVINHQVFEAQRKIHNLESKLSRSSVLYGEIEAQDHYKSKKEIEDFKINVLHVKNEMKPHEYVDCSSAYSNPTKNKIEQTFNKNKCKKLKVESKVEPIDLSDMFISDDDEPLANINTSEELAKRATQKVQIRKPKREITKPKKEITTQAPKVKNKIKCAQNDAIKRRNKRITVFEPKFYEGFATVVNMTPDEARNEILQRKDTSNYLNASHKCNLCFRGFLTESTYDNHMKKHSQEYGSLACEYCFVRFPNKQRLTNHMTSFHKRKFVCKLCDYVCHSTTQARSHVNMHKGNKYTCNECDATFSQPNSLLSHRRLRHATECVCALCGDTFVTPRGLLCHRNLRHKQESAEPSALCGPHCADCALQFASETAYRRHLILSNKHKHSVSNGCEHCGATFPDRKALKAHILKLHKGKITINCTLCPAKLIPSRAAFEAHMGAKHPTARVPEKHKVVWKSSRRTSAPMHGSERGAPPYVCEVCGETVAKRHAIKYHILKHTGERPLKCGECGKGFATPSTLYIHRATHAPRAFQCHVCVRAFKWRGALNRHLKTHSGVRPYQCDICSKGFLHPCEVRQHVRYTHEKVPWPSKKRKAEN